MVSIVASDTRCDGLAEDQRREAIDQGKHLTGGVLGDLLAALREVCDLRAPD